MIRNWWHCNICETDFAPVLIQEHIRLMHPDLEAESEKWPDGEPIIFEDADEFFL